MLTIQLNGLTICIDCTTEGHLVDAVLRNPADDRDLSPEASEIQFDGLLVVDLADPLDQFLSVAA